MADISRLLPHAGAMVLIDQVIAWDQKRIVCATNSHRSASNPLRLQGRLASVHAIEYAAQAAAIHGGLLENEAPLRLLAGIRDATFSRRSLHDLEGSLGVEADIVFSDRGAAIYHARLIHNTKVIAAMRLTLMTVPGEERPA